MSQAERTTLFDATRWARWQTDATGERHSIYRLAPVHRVIGLAALRELRPRWIVQPETMDAPAPSAVLEATMAVHPKNREKNPTASKDAR